MPPLVSILIGAYNAERWLAETLASALGQTWPNVEVIVVDDGSTDDTLAVARGFEDERLTVLRGPNRGACAARNTAIGHAVGDFVQFLDADDLLAPDKIEVQMRRLAQEPERAVAICAWSRFHNGDIATARFTPQPDWKDFDPARAWLIQSWNGFGTMPPFAWLIPRPVVDEAGPWSDELLINQDGEYFARVLVHASKLAFCGDARAYYRSGLPGSVSQRRGADASRSLFRSYELCEQHLLGVDDSPEARQAVAGLWQAFQYRVYPELPHLVARAEARMAELGGGKLEARVSRLFRPVRDLVGWKPAMRLHRLYYKLRYGR